MLTKEDQEKVIKKLKNMNNEEREDFNNRVREAFNSSKAAIYVKKNVCMCCYCNANRPIG